MLFFMGFVILWILVFSVKIKGKQTAASEMDEPEEFNRMGLFDLYTRRNVMVVYAYLGGWMMKQNNRDARDKMRFIQSYFRQYFQGAHNVSEEMVRALRNPIDLNSITRWINRVMKKPEDKRQLIDFLIALCLEDGDVMQAEYDALLQLSRSIGVVQEQLEASIDAHKKRKEQQDSRYTEPEPVRRSASKRQQALSCLELKEVCTETDIKKAYRNLAKRYHPDKFQQASEQQRVETSRKFVEIQQAYEYLMEVV